MASLTLAVPVANGQGAAQTWNGYGGLAWCVVTAADGGTVTLQVSGDGGVSYQTAVDSGGNAITFAATGHNSFAYPPGVKLRASLAGSSGATDVDLTIVYGVALTYAGVPQYDV